MRRLLRRCYSEEERSKFIFKGVNKVILVGNVGKDPILRPLKNEVGHMASFTLATNEIFKDEQGQYQSKPQWHQIVCFHPHFSSYIENHVSVGSRIYVEGELRTRSYQSNDEVKYITEVVVKNQSHNVLLLSHKYSPPQDGEMP